MISIIICSRSAALLQTVSQSVAETIGTPYEIVAIDNSDGALGICAAYNKGARQSKYGILCFMHEDITYHTRHWGLQVAEVLKDTSIGLLGVTGTTYLAQAPGEWWASGMMYARRNVMEAYADGRQEYVLQNPKNETLADVVVVDGLWFCTRKEVWAAHPFDEQAFPFFHLYDLDFSVQVFQRYRVVVCFTILIEHASRGSFNKAWLTSTFAFIRKWKRALPMGTVPVSKKERTKLEALAYQHFTSRLVSIGYAPAVVLKYAVKSVLRSVNKDTLWLVKRALHGWLRAAGNP